MASQGVVDQADVIGRHTFADEGVEAVETTKAGLAQGAALGGVGVHIVEMLVTGRVFGGFVIQGQGVLACGLDQAGQGEQGDAAAVQ
ncbi:hypothetical protein D3C71_1938870 [compost metagenome]